MAVIMGRVLPGSKVNPMRRAGIPGPTGEEDDGGGPRLDDEETTSSTGAGSLLNAQTNRQKFLAEQAAAQAALERQQMGSALQAAYLTKQLGAGIPAALTKAIEDQQSTGEQYIADQAAALLSELQKRETTSRGATTTGYSNLMNYLARNQPTAFAQAQRAQPQVVQSTLGQYMEGQGVSPAVAQEAAQLANVQAAGGAANYNQLLNVLAAREQAAQQSRQSEAEMGLSSALANLQGIYGAGTAQLEQQRLAALADLSSRVAANRFSAQQAQIARDQAVQDALASLLGSGTILPSNPDPAIQDLLTKLIPGYGQEEVTQPVTETTTGETTAGKPSNINSPAVMALLNTTAAKRTDKPTAVTNRIYNFVEANPTATKAEVLKEFPNLQGLASLKAKKKK